MQGIYIVNDYSQVPGVDKKINAQIEIINKEGLNLKVYKIHEKFKIDKIFRRIPFIPTISRFKPDDSFKDIQYIYIRKPVIDMYFIKSLKKIKKINPKVKIMIEIPTYPYDGEMSENKLDIPILIKDKIWRQKMDKYVDRIITYSQDKSIFNIKTINISNGVNIDKIRPRNCKQHTGINIIAVASFSIWHGYDRFLKGMWDYYNGENTIPIYLHLVGDGSEINRYKKIVADYNLTDKVIFHGRKVGEELDKVYDICDIALDAMGRHRSGVYYNSTLKGKEYAAKGIPIVSGVETELDYDKDFMYYLRVAADDSNINLHRIIEFYDKVYKNGLSYENIVKDINNYAKKHFDMKVCMKPIIDYIKSNK